MAVLSQLILQTFPNNDMSVYTLTSGSMILGTDREIISIQLSENDLNGIKRTWSTSRVCFDINSCWVRFSSVFIEDISGNPINAVLSRPAFVLTEQVGTFIPDSTPPMLTNFDLDMDTGYITLAFDEPIRYIELVFTELTLSTRVMESSLIHSQVELESLMEMILILFFDLLRLISCRFRP